MSVPPDHLSDIDPSPLPLDVLLSDVEKLPPSPQILPQLLGLLNDDNSSFDEIVQLVSVDLSLAAQVLRLSNSAYYGAATKTYDLADAVQRIGLREVYRLIAMICSKDLLGGASTLFEMEAGALWKYSLACALAMEAMVEVVGGENPATAYTIGLLHSLGKIVLSTREPVIYQKVFELIEREGLGIAQAERKILGYDNATVAGALLRKWDFKDRIATPITYQYRPLKAPDFANLSAMLHLAMWVASNVGFSCGKHAWAMEIDPEAPNVAHVKEELLHGLLITVAEKMEAMKSLMPGV
jgi:HD-like signal output (HDOD) protein